METIKNAWTKIKNYAISIGISVSVIVCSILHYNRRANDKDRDDLRQSGQTYKQLKRRNKELQRSISEVREDYKEAKSIIEDIRNNNSD